MRTKTNRPNLGRQGKIYDDGQGFWLNSQARFEQRTVYRYWRVRILFALMCVALGAMFMWSV